MSKMLIHEYSLSASHVRSGIIDLYIAIDNNLSINFQVYPLSVKMGG